MADVVRSENRIHPNASQVKLASGLDIVAAIWLFISAWAVPMSTNLAWNNVVVAVIVCVLAAVRAFGAYGQAWMSWINALLGLWVLISPWIVTVAPTDSAVWNNVITGLAIIILGAWSAMATNSERTTTIPESRL